MSDSDSMGDFIVSDDSNDGRRRQKKGRSNGKGRSSGKQDAGSRTKERWEDMQRTWDAVKEGADGSLAHAVEGLVEADKRRHLLEDTTPLQRGILRHMTLLLDLSSAMSEKDLRPTRMLLTLNNCATFIRTFFSQNPISQLSIIGTRDGLAMRVSPMSGNPTEHIGALQAIRSQEPHGSPSLMNGLELARAGLRSTPSHGTREVLVIWGALLTADPGDIHQTISKLTQDSIRVSVIGLAARMAICSELVAKTNHLPDSSAATVAGAKAEASYYGVALHEQHFGDLLMAHTIPPVMRSSADDDGSDPSKSNGVSAPSLLQMGFPSRMPEPAPSLCACHGKESRGGYFCTRCSAKVCGLPRQCPVCQLQLVQSTHLARSYHHLFPLKNYVIVSWPQARRVVRENGTIACFACQLPFPNVPEGVKEDGEGGQEGEGGSKARDGDASNAQGQPAAAKDNSNNSNGTTTTTAATTTTKPTKPTKKKREKEKTTGASPSSRYKCTECKRHFCVDCDVLAHEVVHNCAGCLAGGID